MNARSIIITVWISALGYAIDLFDLFLVPALKDKMLPDLGVTPEALTSTYLDVMNWQLGGAAAGAILLWGPLADRFGRRRVLLGSIMLYSLASLWTAFVSGVGELMVARCVCGLGLGAELGAAVTLVSEGVSSDERTRNAKIIGVVGMLGVVAAGLLGWWGGVPWRWAFGIAGVIGLALFVVRHGIGESRLFLEMQENNKTVSHWKALRAVFWTRRIGTLSWCVLVGAPTFFVVGLLVPSAKDYAAAVGIYGAAPSGPLALVFTYLAISFGDWLCGQLAEKLQSRKLALLIFHGVTLLGVASFLIWPARSAEGFYWRCALAGVGIGYWANMTLNAAEQFGTNLRATVTVAVPNLVRLLLVPMAWLYKGDMDLGIIGLKTTWGYVPTLMTIGFMACAVAIVAVLLLPDNYGRNLDFNEDVK